MEKKIFRNKLEVIAMQINYKAMMNLTIGYAQ